MMKTFKYTTSINNIDINVFKNVLNFVGLTIIIRYCHSGELR